MARAIGFEVQRSHSTGFFRNLLEEASNLETGFEWIHRHGYVAIFVLLMFGIVGLPIPDETLLVFSGYLSFKGDLSAPLALASAALGSGCGITISYGLGRLVGPRVRTTLGPWLHLTDERYRAAQQWMNRRGKYALLLTYFVPGLRHLGALVVGASQLPYPAFAMPAYLGAWLWSGTFITLGYVLGEEWVTVSPRLHQAFVWLALCAVSFVCLAILFMRARQGWNLKR